MRRVTRAGRAAAAGSAVRVGRAALLVALAHPVVGCGGVSGQASGLRPAADGPPEVVAAARLVSARALEELHAGDATRLSSMFASGVPTEGAGELVAGFASLGAAPLLELAASHLGNVSGAATASAGDRPIPLAADGLLPPTELVNLQLAGERLYTEVHVVGAAGTRYRPLVLVVLVEQAGEWQLQSVQLGNYAVAGATAQQLAVQAEELQRSRSQPAVAVMIALSGLRALGLAPSLRYTEDAALRGRLNRAGVAATRRIGFPFDADLRPEAAVVSVLRLQMLLVDGEVIPVISYASAVPGLAPGSVQEEARALAAQLGPLADLSGAFDRALFRAFPGGGAGGEPHNVVLPI